MFKPKHMRNWFILPFVLFFLQVSSQEKVIFNDKYTVLRDPGKFRSIEIRGPIKLYYSEDAETHVAVSANSDASRDRIRTTVSEGELKVSLENGVIWDWGNQEFRVYITAPTLERVKASGAADVIIVDALHAENLQIDFSGASDFSGKLDCTTLNVMLSGASDLKTKGTAKQANIQCSGASSFSGTSLKVNEADLNASGASGLRVAVNGTLKAKASGASHIEVKGAPKVYAQKSSGASSIVISN